MVLGFFMILVDSTIVSVATPSLMHAFDAEVAAVMWVTSSYLLAYAVPLLVTGRLGDRVGPKRVYLAGLVVFTAASLWCGLVDSLTMLIMARAVQGLGASMMTPQTMTVITRTFPAARRGQAMVLWGATAGVATLVGPILGGVLIDSWGWEWIFFVNVPVGVLGFLAAARAVPDLATHAHSFDWVGVALSATGLFCGVFAIQEGETYRWGTIYGALSVPSLLVAALVLLALFVWWQSRVEREPLVPLTLFADRNFSLANIAISAVGFSVTAMIFPFMLYAQVVRGLSPTAAALLLAPQAVMSIVLAPLAGRWVDRMHPRLLAGFGLALYSGSLVVMGLLLRPGTPYWQILVTATFLGVASSFMWGPLTTTANRNLPPRLAGAGSGVYNTTRQMGSVLGSAAIAAFLASRLAVHLPGASVGMHGAPGGVMPSHLAEAFSQALVEAMLLPVGVLLISVVAALFFERPHHLSPAGEERSGRPASG
ncbi:DHA2 family efflux MFS transporter permease subunit [Austwickia chelonae]|uniref:DHA2 family efflux MFS transporter permease subunit n=1 Tax=Austwickia chelonae TaxID=100225 RepID=UPI0013C30F00|nr:DHA2 family efflux MFS transporter permease subunit [Austwickia chelonae]